MDTETRRQIAEEITRQLTDEGKIVEGGWAGLRVLSGWDTAPAIQQKELRMAFFAGATHLFSSIVSILEPGSEPTEKDLLRMDKINGELEAFEAELKAELSNDN